VPKKSGAAWYVKDDPTFSDTIATVRRVLWAVPNFSISVLAVRCPKFSPNFTLMAL
jgi:hypothetical protein